MGVTPLFDRILIVPVLIALSAMTFSSSAASDIIPRPKEIRLTGGTIALPAGSTAIVLGDKASEPEKYAAETLQADVARRFGQTWPIMKVLEAGPSGYSDLAMGPGGTLYCFYVRGSFGEHHHNTAHLCVARFNLEWLTDGKDRLAK